MAVEKHGPQFLATPLDWPIGLPIKVSEFSVYYGFAFNTIIILGIMKYNGSFQREC